MEETFLVPFDDNAECRVQYTIGSMVLSYKLHWQYDANRIP